MASNAVRVRREILVKMQEEAGKTPKRECCGLLAGRDGVISEIFRARNAHANPATGYEIAPRELFQLMREMRAQDLQLLGIYHSHPRGENRPSPTDIGQAFYPDTLYVILSPLPGTPQPIRAFLICDGEATEMTIEIV